LGSAENRWLSAGDPVSPGSQVATADQDRF
jgi:hypothetical protein